MNKSTWGGALTFISFLIAALIMEQVALAQTSWVSSSMESDAIATTDAVQAIPWELTHEQWDRYQALIETQTPIEYTQLTPPEVLGIYAESEQELHHFAQLVAKQKKAQLTREIAFSLAVYEAEKILYEGMQPVKPFAKRSEKATIPAETSSMMLLPGDRFIVITDVVSTMTNTLSPLIEHIRKTQHTQLDLYFVGKALDAQQIEQFARAHHIPIDLVAKQQITLNYANQELARKSEKEGLPQVLLERGGKTQWIDDQQLGRML